MYQEWCTLHDIFLFSLSVSTSQLRTATTWLTYFVYLAISGTKLIGCRLQTHTINGVSHPFLPPGKIMKCFSLVLHILIFLLNLTWSKLQNAANVSHMWRQVFSYARNGTFEIRFDESRSSVCFDLRFRLRSYVCQGHPTTVFCNICWEKQTLPGLFDYFSLRSRRLKVVGERENGRARGRHACLVLARLFFFYLWIATNF